jgi:hypothetical protein
MTPNRLHPLAQDYLQRLRRAGRGLPPERRHELVNEIAAHLAEAIAPGASEQEARDAVQRLGSPREIVEAERPDRPGSANPPGRREWATVILLPLGGFVLGVGWLAGVALLWSSRLWTTREKLIGTLIVPGGIATALLVVVLTATKHRCTSLTSTNPLVNPAVHCTPSTGSSGVTTAWQIALIVLCTLGPILSAVYLTRRARERSGFIGPELGSGRAVPGAAERGRLHPL